MTEYTYNDKYSSHCRPKRRSYGRVIHKHTINDIENLISDKNCNLLGLDCGKLYASVCVEEPLFINESCKIELNILENEIVQIIDGQLTIIPDQDWLKLSDDTTPLSINDDIYTFGGTYPGTKDTGMKFSTNSIVIGKTSLDLSNSYEISIGKDAGQGFTSGTQVILIGSNAGFGASDFIDTFGVGNSVFYGSTNIRTSQAMGLSALSESTGLQAVSAFGNGSGISSENCTDCFFGGSFSGQDCVGCQSCTFVGLHAGASTVSNLRSVSLGFYACSEADTCQDLIAIGAYSCFQVANTHGVIGIGNNAGALNSGENSINIGFQAGQSSTFARSVSLGYNTVPDKADQCFIGDANLVEVKTLGDVVGNAFVATSDSTLKKDLLEIEDSLSKVCQLTGYYFQWDEEACKIDEDGHYHVSTTQFGTTHTGVLAQDVQTMSPENVKTTANGKLNVDYTGLIPFLINSIKELKTQIDDINTRLLAVEATIVIEV